MKQLLAVLMAGCAIVSSDGTSVAQTMLTPAQREAFCANQAHARGLTGAAYTSYMANCTGLKPATSGGPSAPPAQPPSSSPPPQPSTGGKPLSRREASCNKAVIELGIPGTAAKTYLQRCLHAL